MEIILLVVVITILLYGIVIYKITKDLYNPILLFIGPIFISVLINRFRYSSIYQISNETYLIYLLGIVSFTIGYTIAIHTYKKGIPSLKEDNSIYYNKGILLLFEILALISAVFSIFYIFEAAKGGPFEYSILRNIRYYCLYIKENSILGKYGIIFSNCVLFIRLYNYLINNKKDKNNLKWIILMSIVTCISLLTTMARTTIISIAIAVMYFISLYLKKNNIKIKKYRFFYYLVIGATVYVLFFIASKTGKTMIEDISTNSSEFWIFPYFGLELHHFDMYVLSHPMISYGYFIFGFFGKFLASIGVLNVDRLFYYIKESNGATFSFVSGPYYDFGVAGVIISMICIGFLIGYIYKKSLINGGYWSIFYTTCIYQCVMAFYAFQFMMSDQMYLLILILILQIRKK